LSWKLQNKEGPLHSIQQKWYHEGLTKQSELDHEQIEDISSLEKEIQTKQSEKIKLNLIQEEVSGIMVRCNKWLVVDVWKHCHYHLHDQT
jgi:hypothetical protein